MTYKRGVQRGQLYFTYTLSAPVWLMKEIEKRAETDFGGNRSALWCAAAMQYMGITEPQEELQK